MSTIRACALLCALFVCAPLLAAPSTCRPPSLEQIATFDVDVRGRDRVQRSVSVPRNARLAIVAVEKNIDVFLSLPAAHLLADNPVARWGPQRIVYDTGASTDLQIELRGKEHERAAGQVTVSVARLPQDSGACTQAQNLLASADRHYAETQLVSLGEKPLPADGTRNEYEASVRDYESAADRLRTGGDSLLRAQALLSSAAASYQTMNVLAGADSALTWRRAQSLSDDAAKAFADVPDGYGVARSRALSAAAALEVASSVRQDNTGGSSTVAILRAARDTLNRVAAFHEQRGETFDRALALNNIGIGFYYEGRYDEALRAYAQAVPLYERMQERPRQAQALQNIAVTQNEVGRYAEARRNFARVLELLDERDDPQLYADILNNRAVGEFALGDLDLALKDYGRALAIHTRIGATREQARSLHGIGAVYYALGDQDLANEHFSRALALRSPTLDPRGRITTLRALANVMASSGHIEQALGLREQALTLVEGVPALRSRVLVQMASDSLALGKTTEAADYVRRALAERVPGDDFSKAQALIERARLEVQSRSLANAARDIAEALPIFRASEAPLDEFNGLLLGARAEVLRGRVGAAQNMVDQALGLAEQVRLQSANPELRAGLWHSVRPAFDLKIELMGDVAEPASPQGQALALKTLAVAEQSRGRALADYERLSGADASSPQRKAIEARREGLYREIAGRRFRLESYLDRGSPNDAHVVAIRADIAALKRDIDLLNADLAARGQRAPDAARAAPSGLDAVLGRLTDDCAVVEYWLGENTAYAWAATVGKVQRVNLGPSAPIAAAARALYESLAKFSTVSSDERLRRSQELYRLIVAPLPEYARRARSLTFVPDGALHYVSFPVLARKDAGKTVFMAEENDIAIVPSLMAVRENAPASGTKFPMDMLLIADPVYSADDPRLAHERTARQVTSLSTTRSGALGRVLERLPGASDEADAIAPMFDPKRLDRVMGFDASREALLARDMTRYRYIHIAAHGIGDSASPKFSQIFMSTYDRAGRPIVGDVYAGDLALRAISADVVVLSACETALGRAFSGEGLLGLRYAAHAGGAHSVVASLWRAPDRSASSIMVAFYKEMIRNGLLPREALARAMRKARATYEDPALWGAFELSIAHPTELLTQAP